MKRFFRTPPKKTKVLLNELIPFSHFLVIDQNGKSLGTLTKDKALQITNDLGLDLLCINNNPQMPVCKILNYDNYRFSQQKAAKKYKNTNNEVEEKELRISPGIDENDLQVKINQCQKFLTKKYRVKLTMRLRGREKYLSGYGLDKIEKVLTTLAKDGVTYKKPQLKNNSYTTFLELKK